MKMDPENGEFYFDKEDLTDFKDRYNKTAGEINQYDYYGGSEFFITDYKEILF